MCSQPWDSMYTTRPSVSCLTSVVNNFSPFYPEVLIYEIEKERKKHTSASFSLCYICGCEMVVKLHKRGGDTPK